MSELMDFSDVARELKVSKDTVKKWRHKGLLPPAVVLPKAVRWRREVIEAWLESHTEQEGKEVVALELRRSSKRQLQ